MKTGRTYVYHPPEAVDTEPVGYVDVEHDLGVYVVSAFFLGQELSRRVVGDMLPFQEARANLAQKRALGRVSWEAGMRFDIPDATTTQSF